MLSLQLKSGEYITIGDEIAVQIFQDGPAFRVSVKAPREVPIVRGEVLERGGEKRPGGLHGQRPKSPSDQKRDARRFEAMAEKKARAEARAREQADIVREMHAILGQMDGLAAGSAGLKNEVQALRARLDSIGAE